MYFYNADTTPPKKVINDMSRDFYTAGFCPGAIVYFSYNVPKGKFCHKNPFCRSKYLNPPKISARIVSKLVR